MTFKRDDGSYFGIALAQERGDLCFQNKLGWYWYDYTAEWAINEKTVTGPFPDQDSAKVDGEYRLDNAGLPANRPEERQDDPVFTPEQLRKDPNPLAKVDGELFIGFDQPMRDGGRGQETHAPVLLVTEAGVAVCSDYHTPTEWRVTGYDADGDAIHVVPWDHVKCVMTPNQMAAYTGCRDADARLLSYAH